MFRFIDYSNFFFLAEKKVEVVFVGGDGGSRERNRCFYLSLQALGRTFSFGCIGAINISIGWRLTGENSVSNVPVRSRDEHEVKEKNKNKWKKVFRCTLEEDSTK